MDNISIMPAAKEKMKNSSKTYILYLANRGG